MKNEMRVEKLSRHPVMGIRIVKRRGFINDWLLRHVADFCRDNDIEQLEVYYGQAAVEEALGSAAPRDTVQEEAPTGVLQEVETEPVGAGVGVQPSEAKLPPKQKGKRRSRKKKGKSLLDG